MVPWLAVMCLAAPLCPQDPVGPPIEEQRRVEAELQRLEGKMRELSGTLREKGQEQYAEKLDRGMLLLREAAVESKVRSVITYLEGSQIENALRSGEQVVEALDALLALLEDRSDLETVRREEKKLEEMGQALRDIRDRQREIRKDTGKLRQDRAGDFERMKQELERVMEEQKELGRRTESGPPQDLLTRMDEMLRQLERLQTDQTDFESSLEASKSKELREAGEALLRMGDLAERRERLRREEELQEARRSQLAKAVETLDQVIADQEKVSARTREAVAGVANKALEREQAELEDRTWELGNKLLTDLPGVSEEERRKVLEPLADANGAQHAAVESLGDGSYSLAAGDQERALKDLEKAREALKALRDGTEQAAAAGAEERRREKEALEAAGADKATPEAARDLERTQKDLIQKEQQAFQGAADRQKELADRAGKLAGPDVPPDVAQKMRGAEQALRQASGEIPQASARKAQAEGRQDLKDAAEALRKAREEMAGRAVPDFKEMEEQQKKLEAELEEKVVKALEKKAKEEKDDARERALQDAIQKGKEAGGDMQEAGKALGRNPPEPSMASRRQGDAQKKMEDLRDRLDELARRPLTEEERKEAGKLAERQEQTRKFTEELEKKLAELQREGAQRSLKSAGGHMQRAQGNLQKGEPEPAEEDEEQALEALRQAEENLEEALEELRRQAEEELLVRLETELRRMVGSQEGLLKSVRELDDVRRKEGAFGRHERLKARALGKSQKELAGQVAEIGKRLEQEEARVFRYVIDGVHDDMAEASDFLEREETGEPTQSVQSGAIRRMKELLEAFHLKRRQLSEKGGGGGGGGGGGRQPLVPDLVQLNLMKKIQEDLLRRTGALAGKSRPGGEDLTPLEKTQLRRLSDEQGKLGDLMKKFIERFDFQKQEAERRSP